MNWTRKTKNNLPESGSIVEAKTKRGSCSCAGIQTVECYYDSENGFSGIIRQDYITHWRISNANDLIKELEKRKCYVAVDCDNCSSLVLS